MEIQLSRDNFEIVKFNNNGREQYLGSKYNMGREIEKLKSKLRDINPKYQVVIFGASGGNSMRSIVEEFAERYIIFIEPLKEFKANLEELLRDKNTKIRVLSLEDDNFKNKLKIAINKRFIEFVVFSNYDLVCTHEVYSLKETIKDIVTDKTINENTRIVFSKDWFENYLSNLPHVLTDLRLDDFKDGFTNKPAIIVSAGPSLEKNVELLKGNEDKFIIITGIRTLNTLRKKGINPDFACVIDGSEAMFKVSEESLDYDTPLFYSEGTNKKIIESYKGKKIYFTSPTFHYINRKLGDFHTEVLFQGGSVAHSCTAIADYLGCDPIIFIGQDLAHTNNQIHAKSATLDTEKLVAEKHDLYVKDIYGQDVGTTYSFEAFRNSFQEFIKQNKEKSFINATEGGANIEGTVVKKLSEVIDQYNMSIDKSLILNVEKVQSDIIGVLNELQNNYAELVKLKKLVNEGIAENKSILKNFFKSNRLFKSTLKKLDEIDNELRGKSSELVLIGSLLTPIIKKIDVAFYDDKIDNFKDEVEHIKFIADKGKILNKSIKENIEDALPSIKMAISALEEIVNGK